MPDTVSDSDVSSVLAAYKSEGDPELYEYAYLELRRFVEESLDIYKVRQSASSRWGRNVVNLIGVVVIHGHIYSMSWR